MSENERSSNIFFFSIRFLFLLILSYLTIYLITDYQTPRGRSDLPFLIFVIDTVNLFIHEGGHGIFQIFGGFIGILGGSLMQILLPVAAIIVNLKSAPNILLLSFYWLGHNLINISIYIGDAPYRSLRLISKHAIHDWGWICDKLEITHLAEGIAAVVMIAGMFACVGTVTFGIYLLVRDIVRSFTPKKA